MKACLCLRSVTPSRGQVCLLSSAELSIMWCATEPLGWARLSRLLTPSALHDGSAAQSRLTGRGAGDGCSSVSSVLHTCRLMSLTCRVTAWILFQTPVRVQNDDVPFWPAFFLFVRTVVFSPAPFTGWVLCVRHMFLEPPAHVISKCLFIPAPGAHLETLSQPRRSLSAHLAFSISRLGPVLAVIRGPRHSALRGRPNCQKPKWPGVIGLDKISPVLLASSHAVMLTQLIEASTLGF